MRLEAGRGGGWRKREVVAVREKERRNLLLPVNQREREKQIRKEKKTLPMTSTDAGRGNCLLFSDLLTLPPPQLNAHSYIYTLCGVYTCINSCVSLSLCSPPLLHDEPTMISLSLPCKNSRHTVATLEAERTEKVNATTVPKTGVTRRQASTNTPSPTLRASLSGTFLRRVDVVNQCLEFAHPRYTSKHARCYCSAWYLQLIPLSLQSC